MTPTSPCRTLPVSWEPFAGPLGVAGAGYLLSVRSGYPNGLAPRPEESYVRGQTGDWLAKLEVPAWGGRVRLLGYGNDNDISTAAGVKVDGRPNLIPRRNNFEWFSQSLGAEWAGACAGTNVHLLAWRAMEGAGSVWAAERAPLDMTAARRDAGFLATLERRAAGGTSTLGVRKTESARRRLLENPFDVVDEAHRSPDQQRPRHPLRAAGEAARGHHRSQVSNQSKGEAMNDQYSYETEVQWIGGRRGLLTAAGFKYDEIEETWIVPVFLPPLVTVESEEDGAYIMEALLEIHGALQSSGVRYNNVAIGGGFVSIVGLTEAHVGTPLAAVA